MKRLVPKVCRYCHDIVNQQTYLSRLVLASERIFYAVVAMFGKAATTVIFLNRDIYIFSSRYPILRLKNLCAIDVSPHEIGYASGHR